jgi:hypothetical protein
MKRIHIVGLCLVAVFAISAMASSAAFAGEYGQCLKISPVTGKALKNTKYKDENCTIKESVSDPDGKYEWYPGAPAKCQGAKNGHYTDNACTVGQKESDPDGKFEARCGAEAGSGGNFGKANNCATFTSKTGFAALSTPALGASAVECQKSTGSGEITGPKSGSTITTFTECSTKGEKCQSKGEPAGTIKTFEILTTLIDHGEKGLSGGEPISGEVWTEFSIKSPETSLAIFSCTGVGFFSAIGSNAGVTEGNINKMGTSNKTEIKVGLGEQDQITKYCEVEEFPCSHGAKEGSAKQEVQKAESFGALSDEIKT